MIPQYIPSPFSHEISLDIDDFPLKLSPHPHNPTALVFRRAVSVRISSPWTLDSTTRTCPIPRCPALRMALRQHGRYPEYPMAAWKIHHWLVVTGTMEFYDFPFSWEVHHPN